LWRDGGAFTASTTPIQTAVDNATAGETICVAAGSYTENVAITTSHLTLRGEGAGVVTVNATSSDHVFEVTADYVNISGFYVTGAIEQLLWHLSGFFEQQHTCEQHRKLELHIRHPLGFFKQ